MKILVTGWNGQNRSFIPHAVAQHLIAAGHEVHGWVWDSDWNQDWPTIYGWVKKNDYEINTYVHACPESNSVPPSPLESYDRVIHLGAISSTTESNVEQVMKQNFDFSLWLLNQCQRHGIPMQYASSASVYGQTTHFQENGVLQPQSPYAYSKYMFDRIIRDNADRLSAPVIGLRYFNVYGPNEAHKKSQASLIFKYDQQTFTNRGLDVFKGSDNFFRDFVWVKDVCQVHEKLLDVDYKGTLNVGTGVATSIMHVAERFQDTMGCEINVIPFPKELEAHYQKYTCADLYQLNKLIDHKFTTFDEYFDEFYCQ